MGTAKKRNAAVRPSASGKKALSRTGGRKKKSTPDKSTVRLVRGFAFLLLALVGLLSLGGAEGFFMIDWYFYLTRGLTGYGYYIFPFCFACGAIILFAKKSAFLSKRITALMLIPVLFGAFMQIYKCGIAAPVGFEGVLELYSGGAELVSCGILSGLAGIGLGMAFSPGGASAVLWILITVCACIAFHWDVARFFEYCAAFFAGVKRWIFADYDYDDSEVPEPELKEPPRIDLPKRKKKSRIDIPLDDAEPDRSASKCAGRSAKSEAEQPSEEFMKKIIEDNAEYTGASAKQELHTAQAERQENGEHGAESADSDEHGKEQKITDITDDFIELSDEAQYEFPPLSLLARPARGSAGAAANEQSENSARLIDTLKSFNIQASVINITHGPSVTRYELQINRGTKYSKITALSDDIALALGAVSVRIAPIPDKLAIGIEVPNRSVETVYIREVIDSAAFKNAKSKVTFAVGKDITGNCIAGDIAKMPHMLIAGTTGSGKSVCINSMLISLLYKSSPDEVRLIMIDPKMIELGCYNGIPHLLIPVVTDPKKAAGALNWAVSEMMKRYKLFSECNVRDLASYNAVQKASENGKPLPQIVIVIDELADLMLVAAREVEEAICRVAQMARAAGMHLIIATQRPSADVITGLMKANIPSRIAFAVASQIESRIILDTSGAEKLIGKGDMLYAPLGAGKPQRIQGCLISSEEVEAVVEFIKQKGTADYSEEVIEHIEKKAAEGEHESGAQNGGEDEEWDELLDQAIEIVVESGQASVSYLQRKLKLGYSRAARIVDQMEEKGIVGPFEGSKPRTVLISKEDWMEMTLRKMD